MALSCLLRSSLHYCKVRPGLSLTFKYSPVSTVACHKIHFLSQENVKTIPVAYTTPVMKLSHVVKQFSTSAVVRTSSKHDHSKIWGYEKALSLALLGICPLGIMFPNVLFDLIMALTVVMHMHWGFEAIVVDYVRPVLFGKFIPKIALALVYVMSIFTLVGLLNLTFNNSGIGNGIRLLWKM